MMAEALRGLLSAPSTRVTRLWLLARLPSLPFWSSASLPEASGCWDGSESWKPSQPANEGRVARFMKSHQWHRHNVSAECHKTTKTISNKKKENLQVMLPRRGRRPKDLLLERATIVLSLILNYERF